MLSKRADLSATDAECTLHMRLLQAAAGHMGNARVSSIDLAYTFLFD
jgi:hypothetical protein